MTPQEEKRPEKNVELRGCLPTHCIGVYLQGGGGGVLATTPGHTSELSRGVTVC